MDGECTEQARLEQLLRMIDSYPRQKRLYNDLFEQAWNAPLTNIKEEKGKLSRRTRGYFGEHYIIKSVSPGSRQVEVTKEECHEETRRRFYSANQILGCMLSHYKVVDRDIYSDEEQVIASPTLRHA